ncbi:MAG: hypothetical protein JXQ72_08615 [Anaerolineae bacterium]|nr:hypothetical protein [Anaerolineae bacterium]
MCGLWKLLLSPMRELWKLQLRLFNPLQWDRVRRQEQFEADFRRYTRRIYNFLQRPENADMKARVLADLTSPKVGHDLIEAMGLDILYGRDFFEYMVSAVQSIRREEGKPYRSFTSLVRGAADTDTGTAPPAP